MCFPHHSSEVRRRIETGRALVCRLSCAAKGVLSGEIVNSPHVVGLVEAHTLVSMSDLLPLRLQHELAVLTPRSRVSTWRARDSLLSSSLFAGLDSRSLSTPRLRRSIASTMASYYPFNLTRDDSQQGSTSNSSSHGPRPSSSGKRRSSQSASQGERSKTATRAPPTPVVRQASPTSHVQTPSVSC